MVAPDEILAIDLCCGAGGWSTAARGLPIRIALAIDMDPVCLITHRMNHPNVAVARGDVRAFRPLAHACDRIDLVLGGIPCNTISRWRQLHRPNATEMTDWQATLDACLEVVRQINPRWWCMEDVCNIEKHLPPLTPYRRLDAGRFSGQNRVRTFVGWFPEPQPNGAEDKVLGDYLRPGPYRIGLRPLKREAARTGWFRAGRHSWWDPARKSFTVCSAGSRRDVENVIVTEQGDRRQLEWQEAALLQGFPSDYLFVGSPTQVSQQIGQAIQIDLGRAILEAICRVASASWETI